MKEEAAHPASLLCSYVNLHHSVFDIRYFDRSVHVETDVRAAALLSGKPASRG